VTRRLTLNRAGLRKSAGGYSAGVGAVARQIRRDQLYEWLRLKGYVAFNLPRLVTMLGAAMLIGIAAIHVYVLIGRPALPMSFIVYTAAVVGCCLLTAVALWLARNPRVPQAAWLFGDLLSVAFLCVYLGSRAVTLPGLEAVTGHWDFAPGTLAGALALVFVTVHMSVLLGINVAYPQRQHWSD
jgi:surface polysaccharide O-acyltransferase-like enzyme